MKVKIIGKHFQEKNKDGKPFNKTWIHVVYPLEDKSEGYRAHTYAVPGDLMPFEEIKLGRFYEVSAYNFTWVYQILLLEDTDF